MRALLSAKIIAVGSELLTPHRSDTNSLYLTARLNALGVDVRAKTIVGDNAGDLATAFGEALVGADLVLLSGGLGPTADDITRETVADVLKLPLDEDEGILAALRERFARRGLQMPEINRRQARVPRGAAILPNPHGTAPGIWIDVGDQVAVLLPGPPRELQAMFDTEVTPRLAARVGGRRLLRRVIKIAGRAESQVDELTQPIYLPMLQWETPIQTTILATPGQIELHLAARSDDLDRMTRALDAAVQRLAEAIGAAAFSVDGRTLAEVVGALLQDRHEHIAVAESCTGGMVLSRLTDVPGSSAWVLGGVMAYADQVKIDQLGVSPALLQEHGAVSEEVAMAMADGVRSRLHADVGVGVTGIAGPTGGTPGKPVGTVAIAVAGLQRASRRFNFLGDRMHVRQQATQAALDMVRRMMLSA